MPYMTKETHEELVELLPHKWKALHPEAIMTKLRDEVAKTEHTHPLSAVQSTHF